MASSGVSFVLKTTGPLEIEPGADGAEGSSKLAYIERPIPRGTGAGVEELDILLYCGFVSCRNVLEAVRRS